MKTDLEVLFDAVNDNVSDEVAWSALQDELQARDDIRWVACAYLRRKRELVQRYQQVISAAGGLGDRLDEISFVVPRWWTRSCNYPISSTDAVPVLFDGFQDAYYDGEVPAMFLFANGMPMPGSLLSKEEIVKAVWDEPAKPTRPVTNLRFDPPYSYDTDYRPTPTHE